MIPALLRTIDERQIENSLFYLSKDPLPCRALNVTLPGHAKCTLYEADDFIESKLHSYGYAVEKELVPVQAFQYDDLVAHKFKKPAPDDPWYDAFNLYARKTGSVYPNEIIVVIAHKDTQSWLSCAPGAHDNAIGTAATLEIARVLNHYQSQRSIWFIFCNEEHWRWTSEVAAKRLVESEYDTIAAINLDGIGGKSAEDKIARRMLNVTRFTTPEGEKLADLMAELNRSYNIGLIQRKHKADFPNDDDGSFIKAGIPAAVLNIGSFPFAEPNYHTTEDHPENVDIENARLATRLTLAAVLHLDQHGKCH
ncbi:M28 family peptidase [candidate division KSB1 bacterium]|nr:M28 family peptidase [candidate division KSB1 bacterium]